MKFFGLKEIKFLKLKWKIYPNL